MTNADKVIVNNIIDALNSVDDLRVYDWTEQQIAEDDLKQVIVCDTDDQITDDEEIAHEAGLEHQLSVSLICTVQNNRESVNDIRELRHEVLQAIGAREREWQREIDGFRIRYLGCESEVIQAAKVKAGCRMNFEVKYISPVWSY